jgi:hypothetical protein
MYFLIHHPFLSYDVFTLVSLLLLRLSIFTKWKLRSNLTRQLISMFPVKGRQKAYSSPCSSFQSSPHNTFRELPFRRRGLVSALNVLHTMTTDASHCALWNVILLHKEYGWRAVVCDIKCPPRPFKRPHLHAWWSCPFLSQTTHRFKYTLVGKVVSDPDMCADISLM